MDQHIFYSPFNTIFSLITTIVAWILLTTVAFPTHDKTAIIFCIVFILLFAVQVTYPSIKSFLFLILQKPAVILTHDYFIDNTTGVKIFWSDVLELSIYKFKGRKFLAFILVDNSIVYKQVLNPIQNFSLRISAKNSKKSFMISLSFLKGRNADLFEIVNSYYQSAPKHKIVKLKTIGLYPLLAVHARHYLCNF